MTVDEDGLRMPQYGTSMHYPHCVDGRCTGCIDTYGAWRGAWYGPAQQCAPALGFHVKQCGCGGLSYPDGGV